MKAVNPITSAGIIIETFCKLNVSPIAMLSILTAKLKISRLLILRMLAGSESFEFLKPSRSIRPPTNNNRMKAAQWSYPDIMSTIVMPTNHPIIGMNTWKAPKLIARRVICRLDILPRQNPVTAATDSTSIDNPIAMRSSELGSIPRFNEIFPKWVVGVV
jgi:hypothetical protein